MGDTTARGRLHTPLPPTLRGRPRPGRGTPLRPVPASPASLVSPAPSPAADGAYPAANPHLGSLLHPEALPGVGSRIPEAYVDLALGHATGVPVPEEAEEVAAAAAASALAAAAHSLGPGPTGRLGAVVMPEGDDVDAEVGVGRVLGVTGAEDMELARGRNPALPKKLMT